MQVPPLTLQQIEDRAAAFNARYGIKASWSDKKIDRALRDHGLPSLDSMPEHGVGALAWDFSVADVVERRRWQRTNAMHRLGHIIAEHPAEAIASCASCVEMTLDHVPPPSRRGPREAELRLRVGYSPWPGWDCWVVLPAPWWFQSVIVFLEKWAERFEWWPALYGLLWRPRSALLAWRQRRYPVTWWEYRSAQEVGDD